MQNTAKAAPKKESEQTTPSSSTTEVRSAAPKYRKVMSERQLQANRANAARSKGRKSQAGIQRSAQNARKHGLRAASVRQDDPAARLSPEEAADYAAFAEPLLSDLAPENARQLALARRIVAGFWASLRLLAFEKEAIRKARSAAATPDRRAAIVLPEGDDFERLMLYQSRISGRLDRAIEQFILEREGRA